jgi:hypothetical protein
MGPNDYVPRVKIVDVGQKVHVPHSFSDECTFTKNGIFNSRNSRFRAQENPNAKHIRRHQHRFVVNAWAAIIDDNLIGDLMVTFT